jgi:hypothetical protein
MIDFPINVFRGPVRGDARARSGTQHPGVALGRPRLVPLAPAP